MPIPEVLASMKGAVEELGRDAGLIIMNALIQEEVS